MKNQSIIKKLTWLLAVGFVSALTLSACKSTNEHPSSSEHPAQKQSAKEHPAGQEHPTGQEHPK